MDLIRCRFFFPATLPAIRVSKSRAVFAGLDVIEQESGLYYFNRMGEPLNNPQLAILRSYSNVLVTPHTAFYTDEAVANMVENSIVCAKKYIEGEETPFLVSFSQI